MHDMKYSVIPILIIFAIIMSPAFGDNYAVRLQNITLFFMTPMSEMVSINDKEGDQFIARVDRSGKNISIQVINVSAGGYKNTQRDSAKLWTDLSGQMGLIELLPGWIDAVDGFAVYEMSKRRMGMALLA